MYSRLYTADFSPNMATVKDDAEGVTAYTRTRWAAACAQLCADEAGKTQNHPSETSRKPKSRGRAPCRETLRRKRPKRAYTAAGGWLFTADVKDALLQQLPSAMATRVLRQSVAADGPMLRALAVCMHLGMEAASGYDVDDLIYAYGAKRREVNKVEERLLAIGGIPTGALEAVRTPGVAGQVFEALSSARTREAAEAEAARVAREAAEAEAARVAREAAEAEETTWCAVESATQLAESARQDHQLESEGVICAEEWERVELRCAISFQRLTDPAKGSMCAHRACCNYQVLRDYVGRVSTKPKECPLATCAARLQRTRDVVRDDALCANLAQAPPGATVVWLRGDEMRTSALAPSLPVNEIGSVSRNKRKQRSTSTAARDSTDDFTKRRSGRRCVIVI